jgi:enediyne biosynthesis protein E4
MKIKYLVIFFLLDFNVNAQKLFTEMKPDKTGINFINAIQESKDMNILTYEYMYNGGGVAIGDINNDGLQDVYFSGNMTENRLYLNKGNFNFEDITFQSGTDASLGFKTGISMVDINNDGYLDIYVCRSVSTDPNYRKNLLYINNKNNTFTERAKEYGLDDASYSTQAYFYDMDLDKDLDMLLLNHPFKIGSANDIHVGYNASGVLAAKVDTARQYVSYRYYENENGKYKDKTFKAGLGTYSFGLSAIIADFNDDSYPDIYACNDFIGPDNLFINNKNGTFTDKRSEYFGHTSNNSMGSDYADINNDGFLDLFVVDMLPPEITRIKTLKGPDPYDIFFKRVEYGYGHQYVKNVMQLNNGNGSYSDISYLSGLAYTDWSWAPLIADFDNDGFKDIFVSKGYLRDLTDMDFTKFKADSVRKKMNDVKSNLELLKLLDLIPTVKKPNYFFKNNGNLTFSNFTNEVGLEKPLWSNGAAYADLDNDGDLDLITNNFFDAAGVYKNNSIENKYGNYLRFAFGADNNLAFGATINIETADGKKQMQNYYPNKGFMSNHEQSVHFGIGNNTKAIATIIWPNGNTQTIDNIAANTVINLSAKNAIDKKPNKPFVQTIFSDITKSTNINYTPTEKDFVDFKLEPLLPHQFSRLGPCVSVADINGDKLQDLFVGGSADVEAKIFMQDNKGSFYRKKNACFDADKKFEDTDCKFVDIDTDGDLDLIVVSGGNEFVNRMDMYPVRLYINDGKGDFSKSKAISGVNISAKSIAANDYDKDGDIDIFIGAFIKPGHYGIIENSVFLQNNAGVFVDIAMQIPELSKVGMVSNAIWSDVDGDSFKDLVIVGEWMPLTIYFNNKGSLKMKPVQYPNTNGWWNKIVEADIDGDNDMDLIGGNLGVNSRYRCDANHPLTMHVSDFDNNGSTDCVISLFGDSYASKASPIAFRDNLLDQMVYLKKKYLRTTPYANATVEDIFTKEQLAKAKLFTANNMQTAVFINDGKGNFTMKPLGAKAQFSTVNSIVVGDWDGDAKKDILLAGNNYETEVETGRDDASIGIMLRGVESGKFKSVDVAQSGFNAFGNVRCMEPIIINNKQAFIIGKNNQPLQIISLNK